MSYESNQAKNKPKKENLSCLDEEATELFKKDIESANLTPDVAKKGLELFKKLTCDERDN
ncbi:hypothetical protein ACXAT3_002696 [Clostridium sporogenes]